MEKFRKAHERRPKSGIRSAKVHKSKSKEMKKMLRKYEDSFTKILINASNVIENIPKKKRAESLLRVTKGLTKIKKIPKTKYYNFDPDGDLATHIKLNLKKSEFTSPSKKRSPKKLKIVTSGSESSDGSEMMELLTELQNESSDEDINDDDDELGSDKSLVIDEEAENLDDSFPGKYVMKPPSDLGEDDDDFDCDMDEDLENDFLEQCTQQPDTSQVDKNDEEPSFNDSKEPGEVNESGDINEADLYDDLDEPATENVDDMLYETAFEATADKNKPSEDTNKPPIDTTHTVDVKQQIANLQNVTIEPVSQPEPVEEVVELISSDDEAEQKTEAPKPVMEDNPAENYDEVSFYTAGPNVVVVLRHPVRLYFWGKFKVQLLYGNVCILGCILQNSQPYEVYSPRGLGKLYFETLPTEDAFNPMVLFPILANTSLNAFNTEQIATSISEHDVVLYLQSNNNTLTSYLNFLNVNPKPFPTSSRASENSEHHYNASLQTFFYKMDECTLGVNIGENWYDLSNHIFSNDGNAKILVCGGKNVGKSTFNRFLLNTQVLQTPVIYVDLDIGQPEFGFPGTISASMIDEPVFGPSYTHTHTSFLHMKFIRDVDVMKNTGLYLNSVKDMVNDLWKEYADYPWIINTMGFVKGFGDSINISCIKLTRPTSVVQIHDKDAKNNYDCYMRPETVHQYQTHNLGVYIPDEQLNFNHMLIMSEAQSGKRNADGKQMRDLKVISYFSNILSDDKFHLTQYKPLE